MMTMMMMTMTSMMAIMIKIEPFHNDDDDDDNVINDGNHDEDFIGDHKSKGNLSKTQITTALKRALIAFT